MIHTDDIRKLSDFRQNASAHLDRLAQTGRIEILTVNGEAKGVVMPPQVYEGLMEELELARNLRLIDRGLEDIRAGRVRDAREAMREIAARHGLKLNR